MSQRLEKPQLSTQEVSPQNGHSPNGLNGHGEDSFSNTVSLRPDASPFSANGSTYKPRTELNGREEILIRHLKGIHDGGGNGATRFELADLYPGDYAMGPRMVENVASMAGHITKHFQENIAPELQGVTLGHAEGGLYRIFPLEETEK